MNTYIANIKTSEGSNNIKLAAVSLQEASQLVESRAKEATSGSYSYTLTQMNPMQSPDAVSQLMNASMELFACLLFMIVADYKLRKWFKS